LNLLNNAGGAGATRHVSPRSPVRANVALLNAARAPISQNPSDFSGSWMPQEHSVLCRMLWRDYFVSCGVLGLKPKVPQGADENTKERAATYNLGTLGGRQEVTSGVLLVSISVRRHRLISIDYITALRFHDRRRDHVRRSQAAFHLN